jgi:hypothetical protein
VASARVFGSPPGPIFGVLGFVYFKSKDEGDGTYDGQIGHAYLHLDDDPPESEGRELRFRPDDKLGEPRRSSLSRLFVR